MTGSRSCDGLLPPCLAAPCNLLLLVSCLIPQVPRVRQASEPGCGPRLLRKAASIFSHRAVSGTMFLWRVVRRRSGRQRMPRAFEIDRFTNAEKPLVRREDASGVSLSIRKGQLGGPLVKRDRLAPRPPERGLILIGPAIFLKRPASVATNAAIFRRF